MKKIELILIFALSLFLLFSCNSTRNPAELSEAETTIRRNTNPVYVTNTKKVYLLPVESIQTSVESYQYFEGDFGSKKFNSNLFLTADSSGISVLILNEMGIEMGLLVYDGESASLESTLFPKSLKCEYILLDLQNAYAEEDALKKHYASYGLEFEEVSQTASSEQNNNAPSSAPGGTQSAPLKTRWIKNGKKIIEKISIFEKKIVIENILRGYSYRLTAAE